MKEITAEQLRLLSQLLSFPEEESLAIISECVASAPWLEPALEELRMGSLSQWQVEHTGLFINNYPKLPCPPYESAYRDGTMGGNRCHTIEDFYHEVGLLPIEGIPGDYLGTMLECAAYLLDQQLRDQPAWHVLWQEHLDRWLPRFARDLKQHSSMKLYQLLADQLSLLCEDAEEEPPPVVEKHSEREEPIGSCQLGN